MVPFASLVLHPSKNRQRQWLYSHHCKLLSHSGGAMYQLPAGTSDDANELCKPYLRAWCICGLSEKWFIPPQELQHAKARLSPCLTWTSRDPKQKLMWLPCLQQYWVSHEPYRFIPVSEIAARFQEYKIGQSNAERLASPFPKEASHKDALIRTNYALKRAPTHLQCIPVRRAFYRAILRLYAFQIQSTAAFVRQ